MEEFAKLFGSGEKQIVVIVQRGKDGDPEIRFFYRPKDLGVCSMAINFPDSEIGWESAEKVLEKLTEERARKIIRGATKDMGIEY